MSRRIPLVSIALIAASAHEVNRAYCTALGDNSQPVWANAPEWQRKSAFLGVHLHLSGEHGPEASHKAWMQQKTEEGWIYGPVKDPALKQHPCMVSFNQLAPEQQAKDFLFRGVVHALSRSTTEADDEIGSIETVDQFAAMLAGWHGNKVEGLQHMVHIPEGSEVEVALEYGVAPRSITLVGDTRVGFQAGILTALAELGELPFVGSIENTELEAADLQAQYGDTGHPVHSIQNWHAATDKDDYNGYYDWVVHRLAPKAANDAIAPSV